MPEIESFYTTENFKREVDALARILLPEIQRFYESEEGKKYFEEWQKNRSKK